VAKTDVEATTAAAFSSSDLAHLALRMRGSEQWSSVPPPPGAAIRPDSGKRRAMETRDDDTVDDGPGRMQPRPWIYV